MTKTTKTPEQKRRAALEALVWKHTHRDFKGKWDNGAKYVLHSVGGLGTTSVQISQLSDADLLAKLPSSVRASVAW